LKQLLAGLFKVCEIKVSGAQLKELAAIIGPGKKHRPLFTLARFSLTLFDRLHC
jgi:hypothetical protein